MFAEASEKVKSLVPCRRTCLIAPFIIPNLDVRTSRDISKKQRCKLVEKFHLYCAIHRIYVKVLAKSISV